MSSEVGNVKLFPSDKMRWEILSLFRFILQNEPPHLQFIRKKIIYTNNNNNNNLAIIRQYRKGGILKVNGSARINPKNPQRDSFYLGLPCSETSPVRSISALMVHGDFDESVAEARVSLHVSKNLYLGKVSTYFVTIFFILNSVAFNLQRLARVFAKK